MGVKGERELRRIQGELDLTVRDHDKAQSAYRRAIGSSQS